MAANKGIRGGRYGRIGETVSTDDPLLEPKGFFALPNQMKGKTNYGVRKFLVFYFDDDADYEAILRTLQVSSRARSHPDLDTKKLVSIINNYKLK